MGEVVIPLEQASSQQPAEGEATGLGQSTLQHPIFKFQPPKRLWIAVPLGSYKLCKRSQPFVAREI